MKIGFDLDNTIICYDEAIEKLARQIIRIENYSNINKSKIKNYFLEKGEEFRWTEFQGTLYGPGMKYAKAYDGFINSLNAVSNIGFEFFIISHRTKFPFVGEKYNLHHHAHTWIKDNINLKNEIIPINNIYFLDTKVEKIEKIKSIECDLFIDDLPEILIGIGTDNNCRKILFDPNDQNKIWQGEKIDKWHDFKHLIDGI